jgi:hypothetical protein
MNPEQVEICPVISEAEAVLRKTGDLSRAFQRLRKSLERCDTCELGEECPAMRQITRDIRLAIAEVRREWADYP